MAKKKQKPIKPSKIPVLFFDGGSRGNPGEAAGAAVIVMPDGFRHTVSQFLDKATNNEAEYTGLIIGLQKAIEQGIQELEVYGDSNLVVNQVNGFWRIKQSHLRPLANLVSSLMEQFSRITLNWVPREQNKLADKAVNNCIDAALGISDKPATKIPLCVKPGVARLIQLGAKARFKDYMRLKSGRDEFTSKRLPGLKKLVPEEVRRAIAAKWDGNDTYLAKVYRWYLRGLPPDMAIHKVSVDAEVEANATGSHPWIEDFFGTEQPRRHQNYPEVEASHQSATVADSQYTVGEVVVVDFPKHPHHGQLGTILEVVGKFLTVEIDGQTYKLKPSQLKTPSLEELVSFGDS